MNPDKTHTFDWIDGAKFSARRGETGITGNIYAGLHEFSDMVFLLHYLRAGDLFFDIGANVGSYTILAGAVSGSNVIAFEPVPATFKRLNDNISLNSLEHLVASKRTCIGDTKGTLKFTEGNDTTNHVVTVDEYHGASISVDVATLDELADEQLPDLIKIDVEGYEMNVLEGGSKTLSNPNLNAVIMEVNGSGGRYGISNKSVLDRMIAFGFSPYVYEPFSRKLEPASDEECNAGNVICVRNEKAVQNRLNTSKAYTLFGRNF